MHQNKTRSGATTRLWMMQWVVYGGPVLGKSYYTVSQVRHDLKWIHAGLPQEKCRLWTAFSTHSVGQGHYRNPALCRVPAALPSAFYRALGKADFAECRPRQSPALGKAIVYRAPGTRHRQALGKDCCAEGQALGKHGSRQRAVSGRLPLTAVSLCRVSNILHSANIVFAECPL